MNVLLFTVLLGLFTYIISNYLCKKKEVNKLGKKEVPVVRGALPFVGHGLFFSKDIIGFIQDCYKNYGPIFKIKIFRNDMLVVCDRPLIKEFFKYKEDAASMYAVLDRLHFADAFSDDPASLPTIIKIVKKSITVRFDEFNPKIQEEASQIQRIPDDYRVFEMFGLLPFCLFP